MVFDDDETTFIINITTNIIIFDIFVFDDETTFIIIITNIIFDFGYFWIQYF